MGKKGKSFADRLQKTIEKHQKRGMESYKMYAKECEKQGVKVGEPIDLMKMMSKKK